MPHADFSWKTEPKAVQTWFKCSLARSLSASARTANETRSGGGDSGASTCRKVAGRGPVKRAFPRARGWRCLGGLALWQGWQTGGNAWTGLVDGGLELSPGNSHFRDRSTTSLQNQFIGCTPVLQAKLQLFSEARYCTLPSRSVSSQTCSKSGMASSLVHLLKGADSRSNVE